MIRHRLLPLTLWTVLFTALGFAFISSVSGRGHDLLNVSRFLLAEIQRTEELNAERDRARRNARDKQRVVKEVIAGHMTLREAADEFEALQRERLGDQYDRLMSTIRGRGGVRDLGQEVIDWVRLCLRNNPLRAAAVVGRLEQEYQEDFRGQQFAHGS
jgi:hypothetical protein